MTHRAPSLRPRPQRLAASLTACAVTMMFACDHVQPPQGTLLVSLETDMALPDELDHVQVQVLSRGVTKHDESYALGTGGEPIPATLVLIEGDDATAPVTVRVAGSRDGEFRTFRQTITTVPPDGGSRLVRMPMQWLCKGMVRTVPDANTAQLNQPASTCPEGGDTCRAGSCVHAEVDASTLPAFTPELVWGGATVAEDGSCFDTVECMKQARPATPDDACTIEMPDGSRINVALRVASSGICDPTQTSCFVPLDAQSSEGWTIDHDTGRIQLPPAACMKLADRSVLGISVSTSCDAKTAAHPPCGEWSRVPSKRPIRPDSAGAPAFKPITVLPIAGTRKQPCCPLLADGNTLYACVCDPQDRTAAELFAIDLREPERIASVATLELPMMRDEFTFAAAIFDGSLYIASHRTVYRRGLRADQPAEAFMVPGSIYDATSLLGDASTLYMLATDLYADDGRTRAPGSSVQVIALSPPAPIRRLDIGGDTAVPQFAQDDDALYAVRRVRMPGSGNVSLLGSAVIRLDKQTAEASAISATQMQPWEADAKRGGYRGVQVSESVFALFESETRANGQRSVQVHAFPRDGSGAGAEPRVLFAVDSNPERTAFQLVGAVADTVILARREPAAASNATESLKSQLIAIPASGAAPHPIAEFTDEVVERLVALERAVYFLSSSGKLYVYPREKLQ